MTFDAREAGTPAAHWRADSRWRDAAHLDLDSVTSLVVIAAHPDDETLGAGGVIATCARRGLPIDVVIVTDGAASHPDDAAMPHRRAAEAVAAIATLAPQARLRLLGFPDGRTREHRESITQALVEVLTSAPAGSTVLAPWRGDGHRDHRVVGEIAARLVAELAEPAQLWEYPIWLWHWGTPDAAEVDWSRMRAAAIDPQPKRSALAAYASQWQHPDPVLSPTMLEHFDGDAEFFLVDGDPISRFLTETYARHDDPWGLESRWYEQRKRSVTLASLPAERYGRVLEIGCSIGVLTEQLAERCDDVLAVDLSAAAVETARARLGDREGVEVVRGDVREGLPPGPWDLIVLSEVGYYLTEAELQRLARDMQLAIGERGTLVACHWRHAAAAHLLSGDQVHEVLDEQGIPRLVHHREADFVLDVYSADSRSVAQREGIV